MEAALTFGIVHVGWARFPVSLRETETPSNTNVLWYKALKVPDFQICPRMVDKPTECILCLNRYQKKTRKGRRENRQTGALP